MTWGDALRTKRLIKMASQLASRIGDSLSSSCRGILSALEGSYRFIRNDAIKPSAIAEGGFKATAERVKESSTLFALEDTTSLSYRHSATEELGSLGGPEQSKSRGFHAHSVLLLDADTEKTVGLIEQQRWIREEENDEVAKKSDATLKESYKWEKASINVSRRLGSEMEKVISVCDREADFSDYLYYKHKENQRFIVRAMHDRPLAGDKNKTLFSSLDGTKELGRYTVNIEQKSGRKARQATMSLRSGQVNFKMPQKKKGTSASTLILNLVIAEECNPPKDRTEPLKWVLLTSEPVTSAEEARLVVRYYELRWRIEEFHKSWKTGCGVERQRMQTANNLERMAVILSFVAVKLL